MTAAISDARVLFGATGKLAYKQILPALQAAVENRGCFVLRKTCSNHCI